MKNKEYNNKGNSLCSEISRNEAEGALFNHKIFFLSQLTNLLDNKSNNFHEHNKAQTSSKDDGMEENNEAYEIFSELKNPQSKKEKKQKKSIKIPKIKKGGN